MKNRLLSIISLFIIPVTMTLAQSYDALWKQADEAAEKDLPKTQMQVLRKIAEKVQKEKSYGQLLKASLKRTSLQVEIAPDSLRPAVEALEQQTTEAERKDPLLAAVLNAVLATVYRDNADLLEDEEGRAGDSCFQKSLRNVPLLAATKAGVFEPMVVTGTDSGIFNNDLLSLLGYHAAQNGYRQAYATMHDYYEQEGNRRAAMMVACDMGQDLDSLIRCYHDLPECGWLAERKLSQMAGKTPKEQMEYADYALRTWPAYQNANYFRNRQQDLTQPAYGVHVERQLSIPSQTCKVTLQNVRNVGRVNMRIWNQKTKQTIDTQTRTFTGHEAYEELEDSMLIPPLPQGIYQIAFTTDNKDIKPDTLVYRVSNLHVLMEGLPGGSTRYVVVNATTGKPVGGAKIEFTSRARYGKKETKATYTADAKGEYEQKDNNEWSTYRAYTADDEYMPAFNRGWSNYTYYESRANQNTVNIYTDRKIYRPGQQVHVSLLAFNTTKGLQANAVGNKQLTLSLRDANNKVVSERQLTTDSYGSASADFTLPASGLTGTFTLRTDFGNGYQSIRVEEYKRPTFEVTFDEVKEAYKVGDTVTVRGTAKSYAGVPVQGAKVRYTVNRYQSYWWWNRTNSGNGQVATGETVTAGDGSFEVRVPMVLEAGSKKKEERKGTFARFYNFVASVDVTDVAGESHEGEMSLPLGTRPTALGVDLPEKALRDSLRQMRFSRRNAAGKEIDGQVTFTIDGMHKQTVKANATVKLPSLPSGRHLVKAVCGEDTLEQAFVLFSLDDPRPCVETHDWFYQSAQEFGKQPVTIQVGSSDEDVTVFYSVFAGNKELDHGTFLLNNSNRRLDYTYKEAYGTGLLLTYAWVRNGVAYTHNAVIRKPLPDKRLNVEWTSFRDRLEPGQRETWTLRVIKPNGSPAKAQLMATLYDKSLDQLMPNAWNLDLGLYQNYPNTQWRGLTLGSIGAYGSAPWKALKTSNWNFSRFSDDIRIYGQRVFMASRALRIRGTGKVMMAKEKMSVRASDMAGNKVFDVVEQMPQFGGDAEIPAEAAPVAETAGTAPQLRENLNETAFFYPAVETDEQGNVTLSFTLPESLTTWNFMGLAHDEQMNHGLLEAEAVAKKTVMVQPNMPRFVRESDEATISARIVNTSEQAVDGEARLQIIDPETENVVYERQASFSAKANETTTAKFGIAPSVLRSGVYICRVVAEGKGFSDGEQHYLPVLPSREMVVNTVPFTQNALGTKRIDVSALFPENATQKRLTVEYTNNPAWLMVQALPFVGDANTHNAISLAAAYYANSLGRYVVEQSPRIKETFRLWQQETGEGASLQSALEKNQDLKTLVLDETPWVSDANREEEQKQALVNFFNENALDYRLQQTLANMKKLQNPDGSFSWWQGMDGSPCMTAQVMEFLTRLNLLTGTRSETADLLADANKYLGQVVVREVKEMKRREKEKKPVYIYDYHALQWVYLNAISGRSLTADERMAKEYLMNYLAKRKLSQSLYAKALMAVVLAKDGQGKRAQEYLQSLKEYTVYKEEMGRYYDTPRAGYSWCDYRIPTQTAVIEALQLITPSDGQTIGEMQRWLLQEKRMQAWDTPINSVNAVFAFLNGRTAILATKEPTVLKLGGQPIETPDATAGLGYVKASVNNLDSQMQKEFTAEKTSEGTSWGALYAQFMQPVAEVENAGSGLKVKREVIGDMKVGARVKVRITIEAERDYDFVQLVDKRAACLEPVGQLSGYHWGYYMAPKDNATNYYFDRLAKGKHVVETDYYIDREGSYQTGTCTVQCAYAPEYTAREKAKTLYIK